MKRYLWILALPLAAAAQIASVELLPATLGYVIDEQAKSVHPIVGVPGSAVLGNALNLGAELRDYSISPDRRYAIGVVDGSDTLAFVRLDGTMGATRATELPVGKPFFSPNSETVAVLKGTQIDVWAGVPDEPRLLASLDSGSLQFSKLAVADGGNLVAGIVGDEIYKLSVDATETLGSGYKELAFRSNTQDLLALEAEGGRVMLFRKADASSPEVAGEFSNARAFALSADDKRMAVVTDSEVVLLDLDSRNSLSLPLDNTAAEGIWRAQGNAVFQLTRGMREDIWLLDADSETPRLVAVSKGVQQ